MAMSDTDPEPTDLEAEAAIDVHRATAAKARRLAGAFGDQQTVNSLNEMATENDFDADHLAGGVENRRLNAVAAALTILDADAEQD